MTEHAVIAASYSDFKLVRSRNVAQIVLELPIEEAEGAIQKFGIPQPGHEIRVAVALLVDQPAKHVPSIDASDRGRMAYDSSTPGEQAVTRSALLARDPEFHRWANVQDENGAAEFIRRRCMVHSRGQIAKDERAFQAFKELENDFRTDVRYGGQ
jgi:hypothetical protein